MFSKTVIIIAYYAARTKKETFTGQTREKKSCDQTSNSGICRMSKLQSYSLSAYYL